MESSFIGEYAEPLFDNRIEKFLTIGDLSSWIVVPEKTIRDWIYKRQIPYVKVGNLIRFRRLEIERWINRGGDPCISNP